MGWLGGAYTGLVTTSVAYLLFPWGARRLTPTAAVVGIMVEPLVATLLEAWAWSTRGVLSLLVRHGKI